MTIEGSYKFRRMSDRITTSGLLNAEQLGNLQREGYQAVIDHLPASSEHPVADEARILRDQGIDYVYIPVDFAAPIHENFVAFSDAMKARADQNVHVHCAANYRVSAFYGLDALANGACTEAEADALVQDVWNQAEHPAWTEFIASERTRMA